MKLIYHITTLAKWAEAQVVGQVMAESLTTEGFIHCSRSDQLLAVADRFFAGIESLLVLAIDESGVAPWLVNEGPADDADPFVQSVFPHIYGPIPFTAVVAIAPLVAGINGRFVWPMEFPRA